MKSCQHRKSHAVFSSTWLLSVYHSPQTSIHMSYPTLEMPWCASNWRISCRTSHHHGIWIVKSVYPCLAKCAERFLTSSGPIKRTIAWESWIRLCMPPSCFSFSRLKVCPTIKQDLSRYIWRLTLMTMWFGRILRCGVFACRDWSTLSSLRQWNPKRRVGKINWKLSSKPIWQLHSQSLRQLVVS